ncbi:MAG TPA: inositol monophosphatase family protein [Longimicrobiales bacterium]|nr:inositol monophosphatase family protein [Longimicrobiales bacterium]
MHDLARTALAAAEAAASVHRRDQGRVVLEGATEKGRSDYVSRTDLDAQSAALDVIRARHTDHTVLAEEDERTVAERIAAWDGSPMWIVDPLDGTANFLHTHPQYAASVAVAVDGRPVAGAVVCGSTGERWWSARGEGAFKGGRPVRVSPARRLRDAMVGTGFPFKLLDRLPDYLGQMDRVLRASSGIRRAGAASLDLCYLAQGSFDAFWELFLQPWDFAAGWLLIEEAGGILTRMDGSPLELVDGTVMAASGAALLEELVRALEGR